MKIWNQKLAMNTKVEYLMLQFILINQNMLYFYGNIIDTNSIYIYLNND